MVQRESAHREPVDWRTVDWRMVGSRTVGSRTVEREPRGGLAPVIRPGTRPGIRLTVLSVLALLTLLTAVSCRGLDPTARADLPVARVVPAADFEVTGDGSHPAWETASWIPLRKREPDGLPYETRVKVLHSPTGLYFLMDGTDRETTASFREDFLDLWTEDVFEVFLWTDERYPIYFEYEISPLGFELPILVPNLDGTFLGWRPWHYDGTRKTRKAVSVVRPPVGTEGALGRWRAEVFIPYELLRPLAQVPPARGTRWRANFYRVDYDDLRQTSWDWAPVGPSFHEFRSFGVLVFE